MNDLNNKQKRDNKGHFLPANGKRFRQSDIDIAVRDALIKAAIVQPYNRLDDISKAFRAGLNASGGWQTHSEKLAKYLRDNNIN